MAANKIELHDIHPAVAIAPIALVAWIVAPLFALGGGATSANAPGEQYAQPGFGAVPGYGSVVDGSGANGGAFGNGGGGSAGGRSAPRRYAAPAPPHNIIVIPDKNVGPPFMMARPPSMLARPGMPLGSYGAPYRGFGTGVPMRAFTSGGFAGRGFAGGGRR